MTNGDEPPTKNRKVIHAACTCRGVANGFTNVVVSKRDGKIELDPHVTGACVLTFDEDEACGLRDLLIVLLG
ncbi:MAG: hypothetical protein DLM61_05650 [Pseudonocardiales bacterium]|nr:MAG: hypothetical protein DLM61_05650 [Pseudonocardiales bacterium]